MVVEWLSNDGTDTLGHVSRLELEGETTTGPHHALTNRDYLAIRQINDEEKLLKDSLIVAGEALGYPTFQGIGSDARITDALVERIQDRMVNGRINLAYTRIPYHYDLNGNVITTEKQVNALKASALVGAQLDAGASAIVPPLPNGLSDLAIFNRLLQRTTLEIQTFDKNKEIIGLVPSMPKGLEIIPSMVKEYVRLGVTTFAIDFSGAALPRSLIRTTVRAIRETMKIKRQQESKDKHYYLHAFNTSVSLKAARSVTPIADILTHAYGIDSTSSVMWGGGILEREKLRFYNVPDYGAYRIGDLDKFPDVKVPFRVPDDAGEAYTRLRAHRIMAYAQDCKTTIVPRISANSYSGYLLTKERPTNQVAEILTDVQEIKAV